jgi:acetyltransferase-like isoleucine patch superfamily enzyme
MTLRGLPWEVKRQFDASLSRARRAAFVTRVRAHAFWQRSRVELDISPNVKWGRDVRATLEPRTRSKITIGSHCKIGDRTLFVLDGGDIELGDWVDIRRDVVFTVAGRLSIEGQNVLQPGIAIHCDDAITLRRLASIGERVTMIDSVHYYTTPDDPFVDNLKTGTIEIGYNVWVGAKATIGRNVRVGDHSVVAGNALLLCDVPPGHLASGVPAEVVRPIRRPWLDGEDSYAENELAE